MKLLVVGGTKFLGVHLVDGALARGHEVTLFNRGRTNSAPRPGVEAIVGDRDGDLQALARRKWDAVVDTCGFVPRVVRKSAAALAQAVHRYVFVSTISVYAEPPGGPFDEDAPTATIADDTIEEVTPDSYGPLKALCEREIVSGFGARALIVRPGLIVGPLDPTDRFTYWPHRFALGGDVLVPGDPAHGISFIDVADLAQWIIRAAESDVSGTFNAAGNPAVTTMGALVEACMAAAGGDARPVWMSESFVAEHHIAPWTELPVWLPAGDDALMHASSARADAAGLTHRPLAETVTATLEWTRRVGLERTLKAGLTREREKELLATWSAKFARKQRGLR